MNQPASARQSAQRSAQRSAVYAFADDFLDAGIDPVVDRLADHGFGGVALATVYHAARDVVPHNPRHAVIHREEGVHYFEPAESVYRGPLRPHRVAGGTAGFDTVLSALTSRALWWQAWTVFLHNGRLATQSPQCAVRNAFGDAYVTDLCPSNADVATYAVDLTTDVARLGPSLLVAESLHHASFNHGYHHERAFVDVPAVTAFLLSVCFCDACVGCAGAGEFGIDGRALAETVRTVVRGSIAGTVTVPDIVTRDELSGVCGGQLAGYLAAREKTVTALAAACAGAARSAGVPFGFMDQTGALKGYLAGEPTGAVAVDEAWQLGIDPAAISETSDSYIALAYAKTPDRVRDDATAYASVIAERADLRCVLRHGMPDSVGTPDLRGKVDVIEAVGAHVDFYHYGLMPLTGLAAAAQALTLAASGSSA